MMITILADYTQLIDEFLCGTLSADAFRSAYLERFKNEERPMDEELFGLLDAVFGDVDSFTMDPQLLSDRPEFFLDEQRLRQRLRAAATELANLASATPRGSPTMLGARGPRH